MKKVIILSLVLALVSFKPKGVEFEYVGRYTPSVKKEKLSEAKRLEDLYPSIWNMLYMSQKLRTEIETRRKDYFSLGYFTYPEGGYETVVDYVSTQLAVFVNGTQQIIVSKDGALTQEQKAAINQADIGSDIWISIKFKLKPSLKYKSDFDGQLVDGSMQVTIIPAQEASFKGRYTGLNAYINQAIFSKVKTPEDQSRLLQGVVSFTIDQHGRPVDVKTVRTTLSLQLDQLIKDAIMKMPDWIPAQNSSGVKVKQYFSIPMGRDAGC